MGMLDLAVEVSFVITDGGLGHNASVGSDGAIVVGGNSGCGGAFC